MANAVPTRSAVVDEEYIISVRQEVLQAFNVANTLVNTRVTMTETYLMSAANVATKKSVTSTEKYMEKLFTLQNPEKPEVTACIQEGVENITRTSDAQSYYVHFYLNEQNTAAQYLADAVILKMHDMSEKLETIYKDFKSCFDEYCRTEQRKNAATIRRYVRNGGISTTAELSFDFDALNENLNNFNQRENEYFEEELEDIYNEVARCVRWK